MIAESVNWSIIIGRNVFTIEYGFGFMALLKKQNAFTPSRDPQGPARARMGMLCYAKILELHQGLRDDATIGPWKSVSSSLHYGDNF
jgi:hypothetical protein